ncbi:hypothetical protein LNQ49_03945 [Flavobacterium sp. F-65]|uniref:Uncharacterized protein n=1 Tax=Flavobacterium pisciphilum TaxID=2893755 RepID=A0ABS8MQ32_9FLAO|nr:hypothetical protein [Flavobacterium sp. F-65]MCC9070753.1 hypothetical protein [Flavobacterium sp. F-65]
MISSISAQTPVAGQAPQSTATAQPPVKKVVTHYGPIVTNSSVNLTVNIGDVGFTGSLPFDEAFTINIPVNESVLNVDIWYRSKPKPININPPTDTDGENGWHKLSGYPLGNSVNYQFAVPALRPNKYYQFYFKYKRKPDALDKAFLTTFTKETIIPELNNKAIATIHRRLNFEFTNGEVSTMIEAIKTKIRKYVADKDKGLTVDFSMINDRQYQNLFNSLKNISNAFETSEVYKRTINSNTASFTTTHQNFRAYRNTYNASGQTEEIHSNVEHMDNILLALQAFLSPPFNATTPGPVLNYTDNCQFILQQLEMIKIDGDPAYMSLKDTVIGFVKSNMTKIAFYYQSLNDASDITNAQSNSFVEIVVSNLSNNIVIDGTTISGDFDTSASYYISGDLGVAAIPQFSKIVPYFGTNIYFRPVNKNITLAGSEDDFFWDGFGRRFSLMFGISISSIAKTNYRTDLFGGNFNLVTGAGFRITDYFRLNAGALWYQKLNENPLNSNSNIQPAFFVSFSIDLDVKTALDNLFPTRKAP